MDRMKKAAILTRLLQNLRARNSWCGETHVQKTTFFLQDLMNVPLGFDFILYKHGPFSFELRDELTGFRADKLIALEPQQYPYGPRITATDRSEYIQNISSRTLAEYQDRIAFVAEKLGDKGVADLERLATAFYVTRKEENGLSADERVDQVTKYKPHISYDEARIAVEEVDGIIQDAQGFVH